MKRKNPASVVDTIANEAYFTHFLNSIGVGPMFFSYDEYVGELVRAYVDGLEFRKWLPTAERAAVKTGSSLCFAAVRSDGRCRG